MACIVRIDQKAILKYMTYNYFVYSSFVSLKIRVHDFVLEKKKYLKFKILIKK